MPRSRRPAERTDTSPLLARYAVKFAADVWRYASRTGQWWVPALAFGLAAGSVLLAVTKATVPAVVYVLF